jgi:hypothetical protein
VGLIRRCDLGRLSLSSRLGLQHRFFGPLGGRLRGTRAAARLAASWSRVAIPRTSSSNSRRSFQVVAMSAWSSRNRDSASSCRAATSSHVRARLFSASALASARISPASAVALAISWPVSAFARSASGTRVHDDLRRLGFRPSGGLVRFLPRARRDLLRGLPRSLEDAAGLLRDLFERVPDSRRTRLPPCSPSIAILSGTRTPQALWRRVPFCACLCAG